MSDERLVDLQKQVQASEGFAALKDYFAVCLSFLHYIEETQPTRIVSPVQPNYIFYQYPQGYGYKITRPLNTRLFFESSSTFQAAFARFVDFLADLKSYQETAIERLEHQDYLASKEINGVVYTLQQAIGSVSDAFESANQSRKRVGQLFETLIKLIIQEIGLVCEPRTVNIPIPGYPGYTMSYQLDLVFSRNKALLTSESSSIHPTEVVGSVKTTSKDRIDKIFLDKYLLARLLGREMPVVAIFLHDVQRATIKRKEGDTPFGIASTFKTNHFLGYTVALLHDKSTKVKRKNRVF
jgi:hypothetical protein